MSTIGEYVITFGRVYNGDKTFETGDIIEITADMAGKIGSQVKLVEPEIIAPVKKKPGKDEET